MKSLPLLILFLLCSTMYSTIYSWSDGYPVNSPAISVISEVKTYNWKSDEGWFENQTTKIIIENYNEEGRMVSEEFYYSENILMEKTVYSYGENTVQKTTTNYENIIIRTAAITYETNTITEIVLRPDGTQLLKYISTINNEGQITELKHLNGENDLLFLKEYTYTDSGDVESISLYNPDGSEAVLINIYYDSFDEKGNWLVRSEYYTYSDVWSRPRDVVYRTIEY